MLTSLRYAVWNNSNLPRHNYVMKLKLKDYKYINTNHDKHFLWRKKQVVFMEYELQLPPGNILSSYQISSFGVKSFAFWFCFLGLQL